MEKEQIYGLIRHGLTILGGVLVTKGYIDADVFGESVGAILTLIGVVWSYKSKEK